VQRKINRSPTNKIKEKDNVYHFNNNNNFWNELIAYFPLIRYAPHGKNSSNNSSIVAYVFIAAITFLLSRRLATIGDTHINRLDGEIYKVRR
jgi:hypothetical protein